ncbi:MAG: DUF1295 domain-containing protein [Clostridia bacterium]|nr:DUF1295 domain-containing protein [Clostridia bacterium]
MERKIGRGASFLIVALIYVAATAVGIVVYRALPFAFWVNLLLADIAATVFTFAFSLAFKNASVYDPYWSVQPVVIVVALAIEYGVTLSGGLTLAAICLWGVRLTANWAYTFDGLHAQDWRYTMLREKTGKAYPLINFLGIHLVPTLVVYGCVLPAAFLLTDAPSFHFGVTIGVLLSVCAVVLQGASDIQMQRFRKQKTGGFIRTGLWKYARHPNYLGEILMWWGVAIASVFAMPHRWYLSVGAAANTCLFAFVSIPMAEKRQGRKEGFAAYKAETRVLLPIKKRTARKF